MRIFKRLAWTLLGLTLAWAGLLACRLLPMRTEVRRKSIAVPEAPRAMRDGERNAFATLWLMDVAVSAADPDEVAADS